MPPEKSIEACETLSGSTWSPSPQADTQNGASRMRWTSGRYEGERKSAYNMVRILAAAQAYRGYLAEHAPAGLLEDTTEWFRFMDSYGVRYRDLDAQDAYEARGKIRDILYEQLSALANEQYGSSFFDRAANRSIARISTSLVANMLEYREPKYILSFGASPVREAELAVAWRLGTPFLRLETGLTARNIYARASAMGGRHWAPGVRARLVVPLGALTGSWWQFEPFAGWTGEMGVTRRSTKWYAMGGEVGLYAVLLQRLYLSFGGSWSRKNRQGGEAWSRDLTSLSCFGTLGWRFIW
jgi:hypothetical protein